MTTDCNGYLLKSEIKENKWTQEQVVTKTEKKKAQHCMADKEMGLTHWLVKIPSYILL